MKAWSRLQEIQEAKTHCPHGHKYDEANTLHYRGARKCRECKRAREQRRYAARISSESEVSDGQLSGPETERPLV
jgi:hypothetical protein